MSSPPLDFQTEGTGFESHQGNMCCCFFFFKYLFSLHSLKDAQILMNVVFFFMLIMIEISQSN